MQMESVTPNYNPDLVESTSGRPLPCSSVGRKLHRFYKLVSAIPHPPSVLSLDHRHGGLVVKASAS